jgi:hypothetical protein
VAAQQVAERQAVDVLEDEELIARGVDHEVEELGDVGVTQAAGGPGFAEEARPCLGVVVQIGVDHLGDADLVEEEVSHLVDGAHPSFPDLGQDLVLPVDLALEVGHARRPGAVGWESSRKRRPTPG